VSGKLLEGTVKWLKNSNRFLVVPQEAGAQVIDENSPSSMAFLTVSHFLHMLRIERQRTERSKKPFLLLLLDISNLTTKKHHKETFDKLKSALASSLRETDILGWHDHYRVIGVIVTEMASLDRRSIEDIFRNIHSRFSNKLDSELNSQINISFHVYPETKSSCSIDGPFNRRLYPELAKRDIGYKFSMAIKCAFDFVGSFIALLCFSPILLAATIAIKITSEGPVLFRQERLGLNGKTFNLLKFRSMYSNCDSIEHREYIKKYIGDQKCSAIEPGIFKLINDPRVTPVGRFLRKTSIDELPQLINVLKGDMSLVGPRPPIAYECEHYDIWHRRRLLSCKTGITGLWQVTGRSRTTFDEMVRLDIKYISEWSLWTDLKILLKTPKAIVSGSGAY
jgi:lipopolysaccharide/colanic/teichoic acid biosynthesis glycosyltransferase